MGSNPTCNPFLKYSFLFAPLSFFDGILCSFFSKITLITCEFTFYRKKLTRYRWPFEAFSYGTVLTLPLPMHFQDMLVPKSLLRVLLGIVALFLLEVSRKCVGPFCDLVNTPEHWKICTSCYVYSSVLVLLLSWRLLHCY